MCIWLYFHGLDYSHERKYRQCQMNTIRHIFLNDKKIAIQVHTETHTRYIFIGQDRNEWYQIILFMLEKSWIH